MNNNLSPQEAISILTQVVNQTRALPNEVDAMREALRVLEEATKPVPSKP